MTITYHYKAYNLTIETPFPIRELVSIASQKTDILIKELDVVDSLPIYTNQESFFNDEMIFQSNATDLLIIIKGIGKYHIKNAQTIHIEREKGVSDDDIVLYLLGTGLACLNMMRGVFALHGSAIHTENGSVIFMGDSGVGKSTTAAKMMEKGYKLQADDVSFIAFDAQNKPWVYPAYPQLKLWYKSVEKLGINKDDLEFVSPLWQKFRVASHHNFETEASPLLAIYELKPSDRTFIEIKPLVKFEKIKILLENTYRNYTIQVLSLEKSHFEFCAKLAANSLIKCVERPKNAFLIDELTDLLEIDFHNL
jgi:uncharacterized ubiquitin-like protein YukD